MSESYRQQVGQPTFTNAHASGSFSGCDHLDILDATNCHHENQYHQEQSLLPLQMLAQEAFPPEHLFAYASHSCDVSPQGLHYASPTLPTMAQHYDQGPSMNVGLDDLQAFSSMTPGFNANTYRTPYPASNATSTSSATSPDSANANPVIFEAEDDKRKRNQAASARFRQKKKQREQQLMETSREMQERTKKLEAENDGLKKENTFLKKLLVEKVDHMSDEDLELLKKATKGILNEKARKT